MTPAGTPFRPPSLAAPIGPSAAGSAPASVSHEPSFKPSFEPAVGTEIGDRAPQFSVRTTEGADLSLAALEGRPVWVVFWAPGCPACKVEMRMMEDMYEENRGAGLEIVAIALNTTPSEATAYGEALGVTYPLAIDDRAARDYGVVALPSHFWIDRSGIVRGWLAGEAPPELLAEEVSRILGEDR